MVPIDIHSIMEHAGLRLTDYAFAQSIKPYSFEMREYRLDTTSSELASIPESREMMHAFEGGRCFTLQGRSKFYGLDTYIWNQSPLETVLHVRLENGTCWDEINVAGESVYTNTWTWSKIAEVKVTMIGGNVRVPLRLKTSTEGYLTDTEMQRLFGNFRHARDPRNPDEDRYGGSDPSLLDVMKKLWNDR